MIRSLQIVHSLHVIAVSLCLGGGGLRVAQQRHLLLVYILPDCHNMNELLSTERDLSLRRPTILYNYISYDAKITCTFTQS